MMLGLVLLAGTVGFASTHLIVDQLATRRSPAIIDRRSHRVIPNTAALTRLPGTKHTSSKYVRSAYLEYGQAYLEGPDFGQEFIASITFGSKTFLATVDTGSSDTWLVEAGFTCVNQTNNHTVTEADCYFGSAGFTPDATFIPILDENFNIAYGDGEYLNGILGYETVTVAGITAPKQEVALARLAAWDGDGISSGLIGLAFPGLTSAFAGTNPLDDSNGDPGGRPSNREVYSSFMNTVFFVENVTAPLFSLALSRDESNTSFGGILAIGGVPDLKDPTVNASDVFASSPIEILTMQFIDPSSPEYQFYTITPDGLVYSSSNETSRVDFARTQYIVDSGTTLNYLPADDATAVNALFDPPAQNISGFFFVECNATAPEFGVAIGAEGKVFYTNPYDLVLEFGKDPLCISGVQDGGSGPYILGDVFLKNVLAIYDVGNLTMEFSARVYYES